MISRLRECIVAATCFCSVPALVMAACADFYERLFAAT